MKIKDSDLDVLASVIETDLSFAERGEMADWLRGDARRILARYHQGLPPALPDEDGTDKEATDGQGNPGELTLSVSVSGDEDGTRARHMNVVINLVPFLAGLVAALALHLVGWPHGFGFWLVAVGTVVSTAGLMGLFGFRVLRWRR